jgi:predicted branched-subunit amino acid permease
MPKPIVFTRGGMARGARESAPILLAFVPFGLIAGIAAQGQGLSLTEAVGMSLFVFAGSAQLLALSTWAEPVPILPIIFATFVVNLRFALMGPVLAPWLNSLRGWRLFACLFVVVDQNWAQSVKEMRAGGRDVGFFFGGGLVFWLTWAVTTGAGYLLGTVLAPAPGHPLFFAALAVFIAMLAGLWRGRTDLLPWIVAGAAALLTWRLLPGTSWHILVGALSGSIAGALRDRLRRVYPGATL